MTAIWDDHTQAAGFEDFFKYFTDLGFRYHAGFTVSPKNQNTILHSSVRGDDPMRNPTF